MNFSDLSITYVPLLIFCVWGNNIMTPDLMKSQLENQFDNSVLLQHIFNLTLMYVIFTSLIKRKTLNSFVITILAYLWFLLINKVNVKNRGKIFCLLSLGYIYNHDLEKKHISLVKINKMEAMEYRKFINKRNNIILISILLFTIYYVDYNNF